MSTLHLPWPKFKNIHRAIADGSPGFHLHDDKDMTVVVLEKLDGSNLGLEIDPNLGLVAVHGRNSLLWTKAQSDDALSAGCHKGSKNDGSLSSSSQDETEEESPPWSIRYGHCKASLRCLISLIPKLQTLAASLILEESESLRNAYRVNAEKANLPSTDHSSIGIEIQTITFFGELYRTSKSMGNNGPSSSWHPFGYGFYYRVNECSGNNQNASSTTIGQWIRTMTIALYQTLVDHGLEPPQLLFSGGTLSDAVASLFPRMMDPPNPQFEGVFITPAEIYHYKEDSSSSNDNKNNNGNEGQGWRPRSGCIGAKWKTGYHEEQTNFVLDCKPFRRMAGFSSQPMLQVVNQLRLVYDTKAEFRKKKKKNTQPSNTKSINQEQSSAPKSCPEKPLAPRLNEAADTKEEMLHDQILLALHSVLSKSRYSAREIRDLMKSKDPIGVAEMKRIHTETMQDVMDTFADSDNDDSLLLPACNAQQQHDYEQGAMTTLETKQHELLKKQVGRVISTYIMSCR